MSIELAYQYLFLSVLIVLGILLGIVLIRSIIGPRITDRILCINMIGTLVICMIAILAVRQKEGYLVDISLIYAMISFLSVLILASVYIRGKHSGSSEGQTEEAARLNDLMASDSVVTKADTADMSGTAVFETAENEMVGKEESHE